MFKKKDRQKKRKIIRRIIKSIICVAFLALIACAVWYLFVSSYFHYGYVEVTGNQNITREEILKIARIEEPVNLFKIWPNNVIKHLSGDLRLIAVSAGYKFPNTLQIDVKERKAAAYMISDYGYVLIDNEALVISYLKAISNSSVPIITGKKVGAVFVGDKIEINNLAKALGFLAMLPENVLPDISEIHMREDGTYLLYTLNGTKVRLGKLDDIENKSLLFLEIMNEAKKNNLSVEYIDVDYNPPVIKLKGKG